MFSDPTGPHLDRLRIDVAELAVDCLNQLRRDYQLPIIITSSLRSQSEQDALVLAGRSRTYKSYHLTGQAFDVDIAGVDRNQVPEHTWAIVSSVFETAGFIWGGNWKTFVDKGHFEYH
jgi:peptidoglycan L-alanyl-D-glutamate endopeptidase CwlK